MSGERLMEIAPLLPPDTSLVLAWGEGAVPRVQEPSASSAYNWLNGNSAKSNGHDGFFDSTSSGNWVVSNTASGNINYDAEQATGASNLFVTNSFTHTSGI